MLLLQQNQHYRMLPVLSEQELVPVQEQVLPPEQVLPVLESLNDWTYDAIHDALIGLAEKLELKNGRIMWPVRTALSGKAVTPGGAVELAHILGKEEALRRIHLGIAQLAK